MKETIKNILISVIIEIISGILIIGYNFHKDNKVQENSQRYEIEKNYICCNHAGSTVYTFYNLEEVL